MPKNVLVVGMPRSGTSLTASIFANAGYFVAEDESEDLRQGDEYNPSGYFEAEPLIKLNAEIFSAAGYPHDNTWLYDEITEQQALNILELNELPGHKNFVENYDKHNPWIWKDPRLCYTLGYWWSLMDQDNTRVLLLKRNPDETYRSFLRLKWRTESKSDKDDVYRRINHHMEAAERAINKYNIPHLVVNYSEYGTDLEGTAKRIGEFFEFDLSSEGISFNKTLNSSTLRGKLSMAVDKLGDMMPDALRKKLKMYVPSFIFKFIFPNR